MIETEQELRDQFKEMVEEVGMVSGVTTTYCFETAMELDEIMLTEWFNNWSDALHKDGMIDEDAYNGWTLSD